jgi:hypothetical protein
MSSKIILDTKNANTNQSTTSLATRFIGNRDAYRQGTLCFDQGQVEYLLISMNNSKIAWSLNPVRNFTLNPTGNMDGNYYEYKIQTYDAIKSPVPTSTKFLKPNLFYSLVNNLTDADFYLEEPLFHWTRNDSSKQRFDWDGQNWKLLKGGSPVSLGILTTSEYSLPKGLIDEDNVFVNLIYIGQDLIPATTKKFSVKPDPFTFDGTFDVAIFVDQNKVQFKDAFIQANAGKEIWFFNESLDTSDGIVHPIYDSYYLSPKPQGFETPLLRLGNREYLSVQYYDDESLFPLSLEKGIAYISKQTSKVSLLNPDNYTLYYDGLVLSSKPVSFVEPVLIENGKINPKTNFTAGFDVIADGTGILPTGDNPTSSRPDGSGLKIAVLNKYNYVINDVGDMIDVNIYPTYEDLPNDLKWSKAYLTLVKNPSDFTINIEFKSTFLSFQQDKGRSLYFTQSAIPLKSYTKYNDTDFRIYSAKQDKYTITGGVLRLVINGITRNLDFNSLTGNKQAWEIQDHFDTLLGSSNNPIKSENRYLVIKASSSVQILDTSDLEILQALGFVTHQNITDWYLTTGLYFDLQKRNDNNADYDFTSTILYNDIQVTKEIIQSTYAFLDFIPREDFDGYSENTFFKVGKNTLTADVEIQHLFNESKFAWIRNITRTRKIDTPTAILDLEPGVVDQSTSITLTKDKFTANLVENETFDTNIAGFARYFTRYSKQIEQGFNAVINDEEYTLDATYDINPNDWIQTSTHFFKVLDVNANVLSLSSIPSDTSWKAFKGYSEPDPSLLTSECFISLNNVRSFLKVKKVHATGSNTLKQTITAKCSIEENLIARFNDNTEQAVTILKDVALGLSTDQCFVDITDPRVLDLQFKIRVGSDATLYTPVFDTPSADVSINSSTGEITLSTALTSLTGDVVFIPLAYQNIEVLISSETTSEFYGVNKPAYIIEEVSHDDYVVETTGGNISFLSPLDAGVSIEVEYYTDENTQIVEPILFTIQNETTTKITSTKYSFNPNDYTIEQTVTPQVYVGAEIVGIFDDTQIPTFDYTTNILTLPNANTEDYTVKISYSIKQAIGGEYTIKVVNPIWLPLMQIPKGSTGFDIYGDYTSIVKANSVIKSTTEFFVVDTATYANGKTTITFDGNPAKFDSGARSPSDDPKIFVLSNENIFIALSTLTGNNNHVINAKPLSSSITISEDVTAFIQVNTLMFLDTDCYQVKSIQLSDDQTRTIITFTSVLSIDVSSEPIITVSARPVYNQNDTKIYGKPFLADQDYKLIKYDTEFGIGSELVPNFDYSINDTTGEIQLNLNHSVQPNISYYFFHTRPQSLSPFLSNGRLIYPTFKANFNQYIESPYIGKKLFAKCVINAQDQFYLRVVEQDDYESEVNFTTSSTNGRSKSFGDTPKGVGLGIYDDLAKDVIARKNLSDYNQVITNLENLDLDRSVGDQDGAFKFEIIQATSDYFGTGLEDPLTRELNPRYVALEILNVENPSTYLLPTDPIKISASYNPVTGGLTVGSNPTASQIDTIINKQKSLIYNDIDDLVLTDTKSVSTFYFLGINSTLYFIWKSMSKDSVFSRLYPEKMQSAYFLADGDFNFLDTYGKRIGSVSNPLLNPITNISSLTMRKRAGAYFVYDYSSTGYAGISTNPTLILSSVPLSEFPIDQDTGLPNTNELIHSSNPTGSTYSVASGNPTLVIPPLSIGNLIAISNDNNTFTSIKDRNSPVISLTSFDYRNAQIQDIIQGCYVVLNTTAPIVDNISLNATFGQTILQNLSGGDIDNQTPSLFEYRIGFDVKVNYKSGSIIDNSYPSLNDPNLPIKEFVEQNPPSPNECLEGDVFFNYTATEPFEQLPALNGLNQNDSGLLSIPYANLNGKERELLNRLTRDIKAILYKQYAGNLVYPDELRFDLNIDTSTGTIINPNIDPTDKNDLVIIKGHGFYQSSSDSELIIPRMNISSNNNIVEYKLSNFITGNEFIVYPPSLISVFPTTVYQYRLKFIPPNTNYDFTSLFNTQQTPILFKFIQAGAYTDTCVQFTFNGSQWSVTTSILSPTSYNISNLDLSTINEIKFQTVGVLSSIYGLTPDIPFNTMIPFTCSLNDSHNDNNLTINEDRCSITHQYIDFSYFAPTNTTIDNVNVQTELIIGITNVAYYDLNLSTPSIQPIATNSSFSSNALQPYTFYSSSNPNTLLIPSFFGKGNIPLSYNNITGNLFTSAKVDTDSTLPTNYTAYFHHSSNSNYFLTLFNISAPIDNVLPNDLVFFNGISLLGIVKETALTPTITINLNPAFPTFSSANNTEIQMIDAFDTSTFTNTTIYIQIDADQSMYKCTGISYNPATKIISIGTIVQYDYNTNSTTPILTPISLSSGYVTGQTIVPFDNFSSSFPFNSNATVNNHTKTFNTNTTANNKITFSTETIFLRAYITTATLTYSITTPAIKLNSTAPSLLNANLATLNTSTLFTDYLTNINTYLFPSPPPVPPNDNLTLPVTFSIRRTRRFDQKFSSFQADYIKNFYLRIQTSSPSISYSNPYLITFNNPTNIDALSIGDILAQANTPFARITNIDNNNFTALIFDQSVTPTANTYYYAYKQNSKPIEQSLIQLINNNLITKNNILASQSPISITNLNEFTFPLTEDITPIKTGQYLFIYPNPLGEARSSTTHPSLDDNRGLYLITNIDTNTRILSLDPIIGTDYLTYDNAYPTNYSFDLIPTVDIPISQWSIIDLAQSNDLPIIAYLLYERLLSYVYNLSSLYASQPYLPTWQDFFYAGYASSTDPDILGIDDTTTITNPQFLDVIGNVDTYPYQPTDQRLSILDRRYYIEDPFLILDGYLNSLPSALKSFLEDTIDGFDLRSSRYYWLNIRANKVYGTKK